MPKKGISIQEQLLAVVEPVVTALGYELVDIEYAAGRGRAVVRIFIDSTNGVTIEDCARVSRELDPVLDVEDVIQSAYDLEVSSPGVNRPVRKAEDFDRFAGEPVRIKTYAPIGDRKVFTGILRGLDGNEVRIELGSDDERRVPLDAIAKANLQRI